MVLDESVLEGVSEKARRVISEIAEGDRGFHGQGFLSELPLAGMMSEDGNGFLHVSDAAAVSIGGNAATFSLSLERSSELSCWFFTVSFGDDEFSGIVRFNSVYNARGMFSFAFVNDNDGADTESITMSLPYTAFFAMVK